MTLRLLAAVAALALASAAPAPRYAITASVPLGAPDRWDYLIADPVAQRLYAAHGDRLTTVDTRTLSVAGQTPVPGGAHGTAIVPERGKGYVTSGEPGAVVVFDTATLKPLKTIAVHADADAIAADPAGGRVWVMDGDSGLVDVIDPATDTVAATLDVGGKLESAAADGRGRLFAAGAEKREVVVIDTARAVVAARWPVPDCVSPHGLAYDAASARVFTSCVDGQVFALDAADGRIAGRARIGKGSDSLVIDPRARLVLSGNSDGTISVLRIGADGALTPEPDVPTLPGARTIALEPGAPGDAARVFAIAADRSGAPPAVPANGGPPRYKWKPGSVKLLVLTRSP